MSIILSGVAADRNALLVGEAAFARELSQEFAATGSGVVRLSYFTATKTELVGNIRFLTHATAAAATPTLCRMGVYSVAPNGDLTLAGSTSNDTTLFAAANTTYTRALNVPFQKVAGQRYAAAVIVVTAAAAPSFSGMGANPLTSEFALSPRLSGNVSGQTDLPSAVLAGDVSAFPISYYAAVTP